MQNHHHLKSWSTTEWVDASENGVTSCRVLERPTHVEWDQELSICSELLVELERLHDQVVRTCVNWISHKDRTSIHNTDKACAHTQC